MVYSAEVEHMCPLAKAAYHGPAPIPQEGKWVQAKEVKDISGFTHGVGWCAPQQGACKLTLNVKEGVIHEALVETIGCSGMTHSAAMASEILIGKTIIEAMNTRPCLMLLILQCANFSSRSFTAAQSAFSGRWTGSQCFIGRPQKGFTFTGWKMFATTKTGPRYLEMAEGYVEKLR